MLVMKYIKLTNAAMATSIAIAGTANVLTRAIRIQHAYSFGIWLKLTSAAGTVDMTISLQQSYKLPTKEGSSDADWVAPNANSVIVTNRTAETAYIASITPTTAPFLRLLIDGQNSNNADAIAQITLMIQQDI